MMKIALIIVVIIALVVIFGAIFISLKALNQVQKQAKENSEAEQKLKMRHPSIDKELAEIERQKQKLKQKKSSKKHK